MKNASKTNWNRTSDLPIYSTAPKPLCYRGPPLKNELCVIPTMDIENIPKGDGQATLCN